MVVAEMRSTDVPMEVLGLQVEREGRGEDFIELGGNLVDGIRRKIGRRIKRGCRLATCIDSADFAPWRPPEIEVATEGAIDRNQ